jgi:hypothetical protein
VHPFRVAVESGEFGTIGRIFAENVVLHSPIAHRPYRGRGTVVAIIGAVAEVLTGFRFDKEIGAPNIALCASQPWWATWRSKAAISCTPATTD